MGRNGSLLLVMALLACAAGCGNKAKEKDVLYQVGSDVITKSDVDRVWTSFPEQVQVQYMDRRGRQELLDNMVSLELLYQEALKQKLDQDPDIKFRLARSKKNLLAEEVVERSLRIEDLYTFYQDNFIRLDGINFPVDKPENQAEKNAGRTRANEAYQALKNGADFRQVKARYNPESRQDLGYLNRDDLIARFSPEAATEVFNLKKDEPPRFSPPVFTPNGWFIFLALEYPQNLDPKGYDLVWEEIINSKREEIFRGMISDLRNQIPVKPSKDNIEKFLKRGDDWEKEPRNPQTGQTVVPVQGQTPAPQKPQTGDTSKAAPQQGATAQNQPGKKSSN